MPDDEEASPDEAGATARLAALLRRAAAFEDQIKGSTEVVESPPPDKEESVEDALASTSLRLQQLKLKRRRQDMKQRKWLAKWAIRVVVGQLIVADILFGIYLLANLTNVEGAVMIAWLSATVVEVVGILWVIARNLFPFRDKSTPTRGPSGRE